MPVSMELESYVGDQHQITTRPIHVDPNECHTESHHEQPADDEAYTASEKSGRNHSVVENEHPDVSPDGLSGNTTDTTVTTSSDLDKHVAGPDARQHVSNSNVQLSHTDGLQDRSINDSSLRRSTRIRKVNSRYPSQQYCTVVRH